ncbi:PE domain-containing protein [Mycobacterium riyadhense]|uniref:PE domain-containing protein n=1 Tax=Mycobacterium riyadhense TaxID=486698 RepID=UPI0020942A71|nr:PE domain-containing protein [Mycobacterium riyadhense]
MSSFVVVSPQVVLAAAADLSVLGSTISAASAAAASSPASGRCPHGWLRGMWVCSRPKPGHPSGVRLPAVLASPRKRTRWPRATSYGPGWPFTLKQREKKPAASSRRRSHIGA